VADAAGPAEPVQQAWRIREGEFADVQAEDILIKECQGGMGFLQAGQGILFGLGNVLQEAAYVPGGKIAGVALVVEQHQAARPVGTAVPRAGLAEAGLSHLPDEVEQTGRLGRGSSDWDGGRHRVPP
jgi:hypothetical protein